MALSLKQKIGIQLLFLGVVVLGLTHCTTPMHRKFGEIHEGMDKSLVVETLGSPKWKRMWRGEEHWAYIFYKNNQKMVREVHFEFGEVIRLSQRSLSYRQYQKIRFSKDFEEYKKAIQNL